MLYGKVSSLLSVTSISW